MDTLYDYRKCLWAIPLAVLLNIRCLQPDTDGDLLGTLNDFFLRSFFDVRSYEGADHTVLIFSFMSMSFILVFAVLCGMDIYREMYSSGIYVITRVKNKRNWFGSMFWGLAKKSLLFSLLYAAIDWALQMYYTRMDMDGASVFALVLAISFLFFTTFFVALLINYFSVRWSTRAGVFGGVAVLFLMVLGVVFCDDIPFFEAVPALRYLDPLYMCNLFYEDTAITIAAALGYYTALLALGVFFFIARVERLDIKLLNEDI